MKSIAAIALCVPLLQAQGERSATRLVTAVRNWQTGEVTRIAIEVSGDFEFRTDRLYNPDRVYFDILNAKPRSSDGRRAWSSDLDDKLVKRVRVAETTPGVTRIVLDLSGPAEISTSQLSSPARLMVELKRGAAPAIPTETIAAAPAMKLPAPPKADLPKPAAEPKIEWPETPKPVAVRAAASEAPSAASPIAASKPSAAKPEPADPPTTAAKPASTPMELGKAARHTSSGANSLTRALGLKVGRIVIDPGHGGHDQGTQGAKGLVEKDLVLDVAQRVGKLIEDNLGAEVIYTRTDDTFIPLEGRTALANERKADLFLSIHANSSQYPRIAGVETFYLNITTSQDALDVASRENATSQKSVFELQDIIHKITMHEKADESREFAMRVQTALFGFTSRNVPGEKNRGIKKAPFVVLLGANMPSILAEIGFLTNAREEAQLKKSEYRQKLADALYRGVSRYAESLSHFQLAQSKE
jgi:N-acetylmuramoyl-L-alanine amidase